MFLIFFISLISAQYRFFTDSSLIKESLVNNYENSLLFDYSLREDINFGEISYLNKIYNNYYINLDYRNNFDNNYAIDVSLIKGFSDKNLYGIFKVNYSYQYIYKQNSFLSFLMETGKSWHKYAYSFSFSKYFSLNSYLSGRYIISIKPAYKFNNYLSLLLAVSFYELSASDENLFEYTNSYERSNYELKLALIYKLEKVVFEPYISQIWYKEFDKNSGILKNNSLLFGIKSIIKL